jgi:hypothetical protein
MLALTSMSVHDFRRDLVTNQLRKTRLDTPKHLWIVSSIPRQLGDINHGQE